MPKVRNFHEKLEADIKRLVAEERERRPAPPERSARALLKESLEAYPGGEPPAPAPEVVAPSGGEETPAAPSADGAGEGAPPAEVKLEVERLLDIVFDKGLEAGIRGARKHSPFVQDAFHDALVDKLLPELERRGIIK